MSRAEVAAVNALLESVVDGVRTARQVSDMMEINLAVIERAVGRLVEQRLGLPPTPPDGDDDPIEWGARMMLERVMRRRWE